MRYQNYFIIFMLLASFLSCKPSLCDDSNFNQAKWISSDSTTKYIICNASTDTLRSMDSVQFVLLGTLNKEGKAVQSSFDSLVFAQMSSWRLRTALASDSNLPSPIKIVLKKLTKNSVGYLRFQLLNNTAISTDRKVMVYFMETIDSVKAISWLNSVKQFDYVDSLNYISKEKALNLYFNNSSEINSMLETNPLPSSAEIFIRPKFYNQRFLDSLKQNFMQTLLVSDMTYTSQTELESLNTLSRLLKTVFIIKIKT